MDEYYYERRYLKIRNAYDLCDYVKLSKILIKYTNLDRFVWACLEGDLVNARKIYDEGGMDIRMCNDCLIRFSCKYRGNLPMITWLYKQGCVDLSSDVGNKLFAMACYTGKQDVVMWLYEMGGIDIHFDNDLPFRYSVIRGNLTIAYWLYMKYNRVVSNNCDYLKPLWWINGNTEKMEDINEFLKSIGIDSF
jgi:hypothetical protein